MTVGNLASTAEAFAPPGQRPTRTRYLFLGYAAVLSLILYLDRTCIAQAAEPIGKEFGLNKTELGWVFAAFILGFVLFEVPSGAWGDRYGPRRVLCRIVLWWSAFTALTGCVWSFTVDSGYRLPLGNGEVPLLISGFMLLLVVRFLFGAGEAGAYPNLAKCSARWFPVAERGMAQGVIVTAGRLGGGLAAGATMAVTAWGESLWAGKGWRFAFWVFGLLGVVWVVWFARWFRDWPADHPAVNAAELALITTEEKTPPHGNAATGNGSSDGRLAASPALVADHYPGVPWRSLLTSTNLWALSLMALCSAFVIYLYFTHFPAYLKERHHLPAAWGWVAGLPMLAGAVGCALGGAWTDRLVRRTGSKRWGRRITGLAGRGGGALLLLAGACADSPFWAVVLISLSAFASDLAVAAQWAVCSDTGGRFIATVFAIMNTGAAVGAVLSPVLAGEMLERLSPTDAQGSFNLLARAQAWDVVLYVFAAVLALAALCWLRIDAEESMVGGAASPESTF